MTDATARFFVLTGGPGAGKSTLLGALGRAGFATVGEAGRAIIRDQVAVGGTALPWADRALYAELMLSWELRAHREAGELDGPVFFDRGVPDVAGYLRLEGLPVPAHVEAAVARLRYHRRVLVAPPWPEIFAKDRERRQDLAEAERTCAAMIETYGAAGYEPVELPRAGVEARLRFVLATLGLR